MFLCVIYVSINRNKSAVMDCLSDIALALIQLKTDAKVIAFFKELLTPSEIETLSKRWRILKMLSEGRSQRDIAQELRVSLCKVTRGAKILKKDGSVIPKIIV